MRGAPSGDLSSWGQVSNFSASLDLWVAFTITLPLCTHSAPVAELIAACCYLFLMPQRIIIWLQVAI